MSICHAGGKYTKFHILAEGKYQQAIRYYEQQRLNFIKWLKISAEVQQTQTTFINNFIESINNSIDNEINKKQVDSAAAQLFQKIENAVVNYLNTSTYSKAQRAQISAALGKVKTIGRDIAEVEGKDMVKKIQTSIDRILMQGEMQQLLDETFQQVLGKGLNSLSQNELQNAYGYVRRIIYNTYRPTVYGYQEASITGRALSGYVNAFSGYFREEILETAGNEFLVSNGLTNLATQKFDTTTVDGAESRTDIIIGCKGQNKAVTAQRIAALDNFMSKVEDLNALQDSGITINLFDPQHFIGAGMQSKSWPTPSFVEQYNSNAKKQLRPFYSIGHRAEFYNEAAVMSSGKYGVYSWHYNIYALSKKIIPILGATNILYSTRNGVLWTAQLIKEFTSRNYYLSYYFTRSKGTFNRPATKEITWQQEVQSANFVGFNDI